MMNLKKTIQLALSAIALLTLGSSLNAASFDCRKASTDIEHVICDDSVLNKLDGEMGSLYHKAKNLPGMKHEQQRWVKHRNHLCGSSDGCLIGETKDRIAAMEHALGSNNSGTTHKSALKGGSVYFPEHGILCDKKAGFCADSEGISLGYTKEYIGQAAQDKWDKMIERDHMDTYDYTLSNGIYCNSKKQKCYTEKFGSVVDEHFTNNLFR
jgi:uncharacterized protein YecT (DUF1311 family)